MQRYQYKPDYAVPPGATLEEMICTLGRTTRDFARLAKLPVKTARAIIAGKAQITPEIAAKLETVTLVPARFWQDLELKYRAQLAKLARRNPA